MSTTKTKISPERWYSLSDLVEQDMFPWCGIDIRRYRKIAENGIAKKYLKPLIAGKGKTTRYRFKGENIISFISQVEAGAIRL